MFVVCNTAGCPTREEGMNVMKNLGTNKTVYKCSNCGCEVIILPEQPPKDAPVIEPKSKDDSVAKGECEQCKEITGGCVDYNSDRCPIKSSEPLNSTRRGG